MKNLTIVLTSIFLALGLPSAAFANEIVEISVGAEDALGDKCDVVARGANVNNLTGSLKIDCKVSGKQDLQGIASSHEHSDCVIHLIGDGSPAADVVITMCGGTPSILCEDFDVGGECTVSATSTSKELDVTIKML